MQFGTQACEGEGGAEGLVGKAEDDPPGVHQDAHDVHDDVSVVHGAVFDDHDDTPMMFLTIMNTLELNPQ